MRELVAEEINQVSGGWDNTHNPMAPNNNPVGFDEGGSESEGGIAGGMWGAMGIGIGVGIAGTDREENSGSAGIGLGMGYLAGASDHDKGEATETMTDSVIVCYGVCVSVGGDTILNDGDGVTVVGGIGYGVYIPLVQD